MYTAAKERKVKTNELSTLTSTCQNYYRDVFRNDMLNNYRTYKKRENGDEKSGDEKMALLNKFKTKQACVLCPLFGRVPETNPLHLDYNHLYDKKFDIGQARKHSLYDNKKELTKCVPVCKYCHGELHYAEDHHPRFYALLVRYMHSFRIKFKNLHDNTMD